MSTTTPNFNFPVPQSTDLVKDGATAIAALGTAIDTDFVDLKGGTTGQVLSKASNTDLDYTWTSPNPGDITGVTAGTGISGGGTSGDVTVTNSMATAIDAKGDLIAGTASDTFSRLAVGSNGQVLTADSTAATGLAWATPTSGSTFKGCMLKNNAAQSISNATYTYLTFDTEQIDTDGFHSTTTNTDRITIPAGLGGKYFIIQQMRFDSNSTGYRRADIELNATYALGVAITTAVNGTATCVTTSTIYTLAAGDYVKATVFQNSGGSLNVTAGGTDAGLASNFFGLYYLGA